MSDDLVRRLRDRGVCSLEHNSCRNDLVCDQAADRIEELEAKLAKAVEALEFYANRENWISVQPYEDANVDVDEGSKARLAIAELKGDPDA